MEIMKLGLTIFRRWILAVVLISSIYSVVGAQTKKPIKQISGGILNGNALTLPKPDYPDDARRAKLSGKVTVQVIIDEAGKVVSANAVSGPNKNISLRVAAETAALKATFSPTRLSGQPVKVSGVIVYNFVAERSNEEKLKVLGVSAFLTIIRSFASDIDKFKEAFEEKNLFKDDIDFGEFGPELKALQSMEKLSVDKRLEAVDTALSSIRSKLTESGQWQFELGKNLGDIFGSMMWLMVSASGPENLDKLDGASLKLTLNKIRDLTLSAPPDFPQDVLAKLKNVATVGDKDDLSSPDNLKDLFEKIQALLEIISPEATK